MKKVLGYSVLGVIIVGYLFYGFAWGVDIYYPNSSYSQLSLDEIGIAFLKGNSILFVTFCVSMAVSIVIIGILQTCFVPREDWMRRPK